MQVLILFGIILFTFETVPGLSESSQQFITNAEIVLVAIFTTEYVLRIIAATHRWKFVRSPFGIIDLIAILPFYLSLGVDLRSLRVLRWFRMFRALKLKLLRYSRALRHFGAAMSLVKEQVVLYLMATMLIVYFAAAGIYFFEHDTQPDKFQSILHSLWWAVVTLTSVGYGDVYPITTGGRIFTGLLLPIGLGVITIPSGLIAYGLTKSHEMKVATQVVEAQPDLQLSALVAELAEMRNMLDGIHERSPERVGQVAQSP